MVAVDASPGNLCEIAGGVNPGRTEEAYNTVLDNGAVFLLRKDNFTTHVRPW